MSLDVIFMARAHLELNERGFIIIGAAQFQTQRCKNFQNKTLQKNLLWSGRNQTSVGGDSMKLCKLVKLANKHYAGNYNCYWLLADLILANLDLRQLPWKVG